MARRPPPSPAPRASQNSDGDAILAVVLVLAIVLFATAGIGYMAFSSAKAKAEEAQKAKAEEAKAAQIAATRPPAPTAPPVDALVLMYECAVPCSTTISYRFRVIWGDSPLRIIYPGNQVVDRKDKDTDYKSPTFDAGEVKFESLDPKNPHFRVQVYRVTFR